MYNYILIIILTFGATILYGQGIIEGKTNKICLHIEGNYDTDVINYRESIEDINCIENVMVPITIHSKKKPLKLLEIVSTGTHDEIKIVKTKRRKIKAILYLDSSFISIICKENKPQTTTLIAYVKIGKNSKPYQLILDIEMNKYKRF